MSETKPSELKYRVVITLIIAAILGGLYYVTEYNEQPQQQRTKKHQPYGNMGGVEFGK